jgi:hypothetical protein
MNKRGISAIIATVLIILITIAVVITLWAMVMPTITDQLSSIRLNVDLIISTTEGYTVWDSSTNLASVQIQRKGDSEDLIGLSLIFNKEGRSIKRFSSDLPGENEKKVYCINFSEAGMPTGELEAIKVAPVFKRMKEGKITSEIKIGTWGKGSLSSSLSCVDLSNGGTPPASLLDVPVTQATATTADLSADPTWYNSEGGNNNIILKLYNIQNYDIYLKSFQLEWNDSGIDLRHIQHRTIDNSWSKPRIWDNGNQPSPVSEPFIADNNNLIIKANNYSVIDDLHFDNAIAPGTQFNLTLNFADISGSDIGSSTLRFII